MRHDGFTLIELIAVLVLIGLLIAFSPLVLDFLLEEKQLESEVARLSTTIDLARTQAILDQAEYAMHYDTEEHRWALQIPVEVTEQTNDPDAKPTKVLKLDEDVTVDELDWHRLPKDFKLEFYEGSKPLDGRFAVTFSPTGTIPPHTVVIENKQVQSLDERDRTRTLKVNFPGIVSYAMGKVTEDFKLTEAELGR